MPFVLKMGALAALVVAVLPCARAADPAVELGDLVFHDLRFSNPQGDLLTSCAMCHTAADPQGDRAFTEFLSRSWRPWRAEDPARETLRNTPTLLDLATSPRFHYDGEFDSIEAQSFHTLTGRNYGWLPHEAEAAMAHVADVARNADPEYVSLCREAFNLDISSAQPREITEALAKAVEAFVLTLESPRDTPADEFMTINGMDAEPAKGELVSEYATRTLARLAALEADGALKRPGDFSEDALEGFRIFFTTKGRDRAGNCVTCHTPPHYSDFAFHNIGVTQEEYDGVHGGESYSNYAIPGAGAQRPSMDHMQWPEPGKPDHVDLGAWNFVDPETSPQRREGESAEAFLERMAGAFKTPTLRHLASTAPYMHNGAYPTIERSILLHIRSAMRGRLNILRSPAGELLNVRITEDDIAPLFAFLNALNERGNRKAAPTSIFEGGDGGYSYSVTQGGDNYPRD